MVTFHLYCRIVNVIPFSGATIEDMYDYLKPMLRKCPDNIILHVGTNNAAREPATRFEKDIHHDISFKNFRDLRDLTANLLTKVCSNADIERRLLLVTGKSLGNQTTNRRNEAKLNIRSRVLGNRQQLQIQEYLIQITIGTLTSSSTKLCPQRKRKENTVQ